jgi:DNA adenine methylase
MTDYTKFTKPNLINECKKFGISGYSKLKKVEIINLLKQNKNEKDENKNKIKIEEIIKEENENEKEENEDKKEIQNLEKQIQKLEIKEIIYEKESEKDYMKNYLKSIMGKEKYKRVDISPLRYAGGKSLAVGIILENLPKLKEKKIISPFIGGGSVELVLASLGFEIIAYDVFSMLIGFWNAIQNDREKFITELLKLIPDSTNFTRNRHILLNYWEKIKPSTLHYETRNRLELTQQEQNLLDNDVTLQSVYYYYNTQLSFGPMYLGWRSSIYLNQEKYNKIIEHIKNIQLGNIKFYCEDFETSISRHQGDFLFLDPPYYLDGDSKMFKGIYPNSNFPIHHVGFQHEKLRDLLRNHKGGFIMTYNDCSIIKEWYKDYIQVFPHWQYTYGQGEIRIGKNREKNKSNIKESHEVLIIHIP